MTSLCLWSFKWSNLVLNQEKYNDYLTRYESIDGSICTVRAVIKDESGRIFQYHNAKLNEFYLPGWKVDIGETLEHALYREVQEELGIEIVSSQYLLTLKYMGGGIKKIAHYFVVDQYTWTLVNHDAHLMDQYRAEITDSDNDLGFAVNIEGTITDDVQDIMHSYRNLYHILIVASQMSGDYVQAPIKSYDQTKINLSQHYYLYLDQEKQLYYFQDL